HERLCVEVTREPIDPCDQTVGAFGDLAGERLNDANGVLKPVAGALELVQPGDEERLQLPLPDQVRPQEPEHDAAPEAADPAGPRGRVPADRRPVTQEAERPRGRRLTPCPLGSEALELWNPL